MLSERHFSIPDRVFFFFGSLVVAASLVFALLLWPDMPTTLPAQYGWNASAGDVLNSRLTILLLPVLFQLLVTLAIAKGYRHPEFFPFPTRRRLASFDPPIKKALIALARHVLVVSLVIITLIFAHVLQIIALRGLGLDRGNDLSVLVFLILFQGLLAFVYLGWMHHIIRQSAWLPARTS